MPGRRSGAFASCPSARNAGRSVASHPHGSGPPARSGTRWRCGRGPSTRTPAPSAETTCTSLPSNTRPAPRETRTILACRLPGGRAGTCSTSTASRSATSAALVSMYRPLRPARGCGDSDLVSSPTPAALAQDALGVPPVQQGVGLLQDREDPRGWVPRRGLRPALGASSELYHARADEGVRTRATYGCCRSQGCTMGCSLIQTAGRRIVCWGGSRHNDPLGGLAPLPRHGLPASGTVARSQSSWCCPV